MTFHTARAAGSDLRPCVGLSQSLLSLTPPSLVTSQVTAVPDLSLGAGKEHVKWGFFVASVCTDGSGVCGCVTVCVCVCISSHIFASSLC